MAKLEFYGTGLDDRKIKHVSAFPPALASPDRSSHLEKRNMQDTFFKAASKERHDPSVYRDNYMMNNDNYSDKKKFFQSHYERIHHRSKSDHTTKDEFYSSPQHFANLKLSQERVFAVSPSIGRMTSTNNFTQQARSLSRLNSNSNSKPLPQLGTTNNTPTSTMRQTINSTKSQSNLLERDHFYVTRPLLRINKDFVEDPLVKNVQVVSDDLPNWCKTTNKYYTPENIDKTKKHKVVVKANQDIFGNELRSYPNKFMFFCEPPSSGQRFEKNKMVIADRTEDGSIKKKLTKKELMLGKCRLKWDEDLNKQKYEPRLPFKIGHDKEPFIKKIEMKRNQSVNEFQKIGEQKQFRLESKDKPVQLKIGHGIPETINPIKFRQE